MATTRPLKIAFTYDSKSEWTAMGYSAVQCAEFDSDETIDVIATSLSKLGTVEKIGGVKALTRVLANTKPDWDVVFNICEGMGSIGREAQVPALLEGWGIPFTFSDSATLALCLDKAKTKMILEHYGIPTAPFVCIPPRDSWNNGAYPLSNIWNSPHGQSLKKMFPLFIKPAVEGSSIGITKASKVADEVQLAQSLEDISQRYPAQSILIERFLAGREITVGIMGTGADARVIGACEIIFLKDNRNIPLDPTKDYDNCDPSLFEIDFFGYELKSACHANPQFVNMNMDDPAAQGAGEVALKAWKALGCRDGGRVDIRFDTKGMDAVPNFMEVNPLPGLRPEISGFPVIAQASGIGYDELLESIVGSALKRCKPSL